MTEILTNADPTAFGIIRDDCALSFPENMPFEQWAAFGAKFFRRADDMLTWYAGDWLAFGSDAYAYDDKFTLAIEATGLDYHTLRRYAWVSKAITVERRRSNLSWSIHNEVAKLDAVSQAHWLEQAARLALSARELRESIVEGRLIRLADLERAREAKKGLYTPHAVRSLFSRALRQVTERLPLDRWNPKMRAAWKEELKPIVELYERL